MSYDDVDEIVREFLIESYEALESLDRDLVDLESEPDSKEILGGIFRTFHTIKGTSGFLDFKKLEALTHVAENLLGLLRDGHLSLNQAMTTALLSTCDALREMLSCVEQTGNDGDSDYLELVNELKRLRDGEEDAIGAPAETPAPESEEASPAAVGSPASAPPAAGDKPVFDVLVIDDMPNVSKKLRGMLPDSFAVEDASDQPAAVNFCLENTIRTIVVDTDMPGIDTSALLRQLQLLQPDAHFVALFMRNTENKEGVVEELGCHGFLEKPFDAEKVTGFVESHQERCGDADAAAAEQAAAEKAAAEKAAAEKAAAEKAAAEKAAAEKAAAEKAAAEKTAAEKPAAAKAGEKSREESRPPALSETRIRVDVDVLDKLMNLAGELVLARNQILQFVAMHESPALNAACQGLNLITSELQEEIMKTRMQPINSVWKKLPRVVRDLAKACGKQVRLEMDGKNTDLDRTIIEAIKDPLTHLVRNAIDHGLEAPQDRIKSGKEPEGVLRLRAYHEGGQVNIEIGDDGRGMDPDQIGAKAVEKGLVTTQQISSMQPEDLQRLVFLPGFSTAAKITNVSGRGVGMDVVKTNIEKIGGAVDIRSQLGHGTTFQVKIPLTLAIVPALLVRHAGVRYAIQQVNLVELVRISAEAAGHRIENIHGCPVYRLRGKLLPMIYLDEALNLDRSQDMPAGTINIVVLQVGSNQFGLVVDAIEDTTEIVVKPLGDQLKNITVFSGATILGDGTVGLIMDVPNIAQSAGVMSTMAQDVVRTDLDGARGLDAKQTLLLINSPDDGQVAIPLEKITRLEVFRKSQVEAAGSADVIQYGGEILPLQYIEKLIEERRMTPRNSDEPIDDALQVIVFSRAEGLIGLVVDNVIDVVQEPVLLQDSAIRRGILGTAIILGRVTEFLDLKSTLGVENLEFKRLHPGVEEGALN